jgi:LDH2 family malate/lactate/ureidoglycolate dehydrogenase
MTDRYAAADLITFAAAMLAAAGLDADKATTSAEILVEGDLMGHTTHGLALLGQNLDEAQAGRMLGTGEPEIVAATPSIETWDGRRLPGPWLVRRAADRASANAAEIGLAGVVIRKSCHIGCLAAYLKRVTDRGQIMLLFSSDPSTISVAPTGGTKRIYTPNPMAAGWPTPDGPVLLDVSTSITTNAMVARLRGEGRQFDHPWLLDNQGAATRDPNSFFADPPGSILPLGGVEYGHKGYALGIMLEALTSALAGYGRADAETRWGGECPGAGDRPGENRRHRGVPARDRLDGRRHPRQPPDPRRPARAPAGRTRPGAAGGAVGRGGGAASGDPAVAGGPGGGDGRGAAGGAGGDLKRDRFRRNGCVARGLSGAPQRHVPALVRT